MRITKAAAAVAGIGLALSMSACSTSSEAAEETAADNAAYCQASATAQFEAAALKALVTNGDATLDQIQEQKDTLVDAVGSAQEAAADLADSVRNQIEIADEAFDDAVGAIPGDATLSEAVPAYRSALDAWDTAMLSIRTEVGCS